MMLHPSVGWNADHGQVSREYSVIMTRKASGSIWMLAGLGSVRRVVVHVQGLVGVTS